MGAARQRFRRDVEAEILRRMREDHDSHITRDEGEETGEKSGLGRKEAARGFLRLAGTVWVGQVTPEEGPSYRVSGPVQDPHWWMAHFDVTWFQREGLLPTPWNR